MWKTLSFLIDTNIKFIFIKMLEWNKLNYIDLVSNSKQFSGMDYKFFSKIQFSVIDLVWFFGENKVVEWIMKCCKSILL